MTDVLHSMGLSYRVNNLKNELEIPVGSIYNYMRAPNFLLPPALFVLIWKRSSTPDCHTDPPHTHTHTLSPVAGRSHRQLRHRPRLLRVRFVSGLKPGAGTGRGAIGAVDHLPCDAAQPPGTRLEMVCL